MPDRLISVFAIVTASALLMTSITSAQETPITDSRHRLNALEQPVLQLAEQVRVMETKHGKDHAESIKLRAELRVLVQKTFAARQDIQRAELAEFTRRLQMMRQAIDAREQSVDRIVDRRVEELLDPNLTWTQSDDKQNPSTAAFKSETREGEAPAEPPSRNNSGTSGTPAAQQELRPPGTSPDENSAPAGRPLEPVAINKIKKNTQKVTLTMFEVTDASFMKDREINAEPTVAPNDLDEQVKKLMESKTAQVLGSHTIETILHRTATFHSGGTFEVPSSSPEESKRNVEFGTRIMITSSMKGDEKVFAFHWDERTLDRNTEIDGIPGVQDKRYDVLIKSPLSGGAGYLCGPFAGSDHDHRRFIHFFLHDAQNTSSVIPSTPPKSAPLQIFLRCDQKMAVNFNSRRGAVRESGHLIVGDLALNDSILFEILQGEDRGEYRLAMEHIGKPDSDNGLDQKVISLIEHNALRIEFTAENQKQAAAGHIIRKMIHVNSQSGNIETTDLPASDHGFSPANIASTEGYVIGVVTIEARTIRRKTSGAAAVFQAETREGEVPAEPLARNDSGIPAAQQELRPPGTSPEENSAPAGRPPEQPEHSQDLLTSLQGEWELEQLSEGDGAEEGNHRRVTVTKDLLNVYAETGEVKNVFQLKVLNDKTVNVVLDPNGERLGLTGMLEITAERFQLCLGKAGTPPAVIAPGANVIYLSAKRPSGSTPDSTISGTPAASAESPE